MILAVAGALLFRDSHTQKKISVLSGGERARLCMAGLLLGTYNILVLDEPGNHLDVDTVEALANALLAYKGTVIFTSHDRHFMKRIATSIVEVRDGTAVNYAGNYEAYLYAVNKEIDDGERELNAKKPNVPKLNTKPNMAAAKSIQDERSVQKELKTLEKKIAQLDTRKREVNDQLMQATDPTEALRLHNELTEITTELETIEHRWCELSAF